MARMFGDLTPFPYDMDFVGLLQDAVQCAVGLASAQCQLDTVYTTRENVRRSVQLEQVALEELLQAVNQATERVAAEAQLAGTRAATATEKLSVAARRLVDSAACQLCSDYSEVERHTEPVRRRASALIVDSVKAFFANHTPPNSELAVHWWLDQNSYQAQLSLATELGLDADFDLKRPFEGQSKSIRRVDDYDSEVVIHTPRPPLYQGASATAERLRLDAFTILEMRLESDGGLIVLRRRPRSGATVQLRFVESGEVKALLLEGADGQDETQWTLCGQDTANVLGLWNRLIAQSLQFAEERASLRAARFEGVPLASLRDPGVLAQRIIRHLAPLAVQVARRALIPGQLALRAVGGKEVVVGSVVTVKQFAETIGSLPEPARRLFAPLQFVPGVEPPAAEPATGPATTRVSRPPLQASERPSGPAQSVDASHGAASSRPPPRKSRMRPPAAASVVQPPRIVAVELNLDDVVELECEEIDAA